VDISQSNWNETDDNNNTAAPDGAPEGMPPSGVNNTMRAMMGAIKRWYDQAVPKATDGTGTSTAYTLSYAVAPTTLPDGMAFLVNFDKTCGAGPTLNVNGLGAKPLYKWTGSWGAVGAFDIVATQILRVVYDATSGAFRVLLPFTNWSTGDAKLTIKSTADAGWVMMNDGTIGSATSGATTRANADTQALYTLIWTNVIDTWAPVTGGRGASAAADFAANKPIALTKQLGRALGISGAGASLTSRALGQTLGEETHVLTTNEMPIHQHDITPAPANLTAGGAVGFGLATGATNVFLGPTQTAPAGLGAAHNNMQPTTFWNVMIKL